MTDEIIEAQNKKATSKATPSWKDPCKEIIIIDLILKADNRLSLEELSYLIFYYSAIKFIFLNLKMHIIIYILLYHQFQPYYSPTQILTIRNLQSLVSCDVKKG